MDDPKEIGLNKQVINIYGKTLSNDVSNEDNNKKLKSRVYSLLFLVSISKRHSSMAMEIIESSVKTLENFDALNAAKAFRILETFAKNLIKYPWKKGYKRVKLYSGVFKLKLDRWLKGSKTIFEALGYKKTRTEFVLHENVSHEVREVIALECYIAAVEMEIYNDIYDKVYNHGYTYKDVHKCRLHCNEDTNECKTWIIKHCVPYRNDSGSYHAAHMKSLNETPDFSTNGFKPRIHNDMPISVSKPQPKQSVSPKQKGDAIGGQPGMEPATIDDHLKESERLLQIGQEQQLPLPKVPPPSYQSMYSTSGQQYDEWGDVRLKIQELGDKFADPGGRGDILRGDNMVPLEVKLPPLDKPVTILPRSCAVESKPLFSIIRDSRRDVLVEDGPEEQPEENIVRHALLSNMNTKVESNRDHTTPFSTFGRSPEGKQSPLSPEIVTLNRPELISGTKPKHNYDGDNDVYVSLRETRSPPLREGKPSFQDNFQKTTQRFYQADSFLSLPYTGDKSGRSSVLSRNTKTTPVARDKLFMRSTSEDMWQCEKCTLANNKNESVCKVCGASREKRPVNPLKSGGNVCSKCTYVNDPGNVECKICKTHINLYNPTYI